jgi:hypothetical protein
MHRLNIDSIGPLPADEEGNEHILVIIDTFTRFVQLYAIKSLHAKVAAKALLNHVGTFGVPDQISSDNGPQFVNAIIEALIKIIEAKQILSIAYSHEENSIVERANKEVMRHLRAIIFDKKLEEAWSTCLPLVSRIMNSAIHESTNCSPAEMLFGGMINLDRKLTLLHGSEKQEEESEKTTSVGEWIAKMLQYQKTVVQIAQETQRKQTAKHTSNDLPIEITHIPLNSMVLLEYPGDMKRPPSKLHTQWKGPMRVVKVVGTEITLYDMVANKELNPVHIKRVKPFLYEPDKTNPKDAAMADTLEYYVEEILGHKGNPRKKSQMRFLVKWQGFPDDKNSWEPWSNLRLVEALHEYLRKNGMANIIPRIDDEKRE